MHFTRVAVFTFILTLIGSPSILNAQDKDKQKPEKPETQKPETQKPEENDLAGFRSVKDAITAEISKTSTVKSASNQPAYLGLVVADHDHQLVVEVVAPNSPADKAGFVEGDQLTKVNESELQNEVQFATAIRKFRQGDKANFLVTRGEESIELTAKLVATSRPLSPNSQRSRRGQLQRPRGYMGVSVEPSREPAGVRISRVVDGSGADLGGLKVGDVILTLSEKKIAGANLSRELATTKPGEKIQMTINRNEEELEMEIELGEVPTRGTTRSSNSRPQPAALRRGEYRLAIVGIEFPDQKHNDKIDIEDWRDSVFSSDSYTGRSATGQRTYGSMNDYYHELSTGEFNIEGEFFDWVEVDKNRMQYNQGSKSVLLDEAMDALLEREGKDAFDNFDGVFFVYAGGRPRVRQGDLFWPHRSTFSHNRKRWSYFIMEEGGRRMADISTMCHEFGHMLGLPDLYAKDPRAEGLSVWCAMANQSRGGRPQHFSAWCKEQLGWLKPTVIDPRVKQKLILSRIENSNTECYKVLLQPDGSEYLLLENRQRVGFDASLPSQGLLIWKISNNRPELLESHGISGPSGPKLFRNSVPYPSDSNNAFTPDTTPSSRTQNGGYPVHITNIEQLPDGRVSFYIGYEFK